MMGHSMMDGMRMSEWGGHYMLSNVLGSLNSQMQPSIQSMMNSGLSMTRFRAWMDSSHMVRKLVLIEQGANTRIVITLVITSINQPMHIMVPSTTLIFVLGGATPHADAEHDGHAHGQADRDHHPHHGGDADAGDDQHPV